MQKYLKILVLLCCFAAKAQKPVWLSVQWPATQEGVFASKNISYNQFFTDSITLHSELNGLLIKCNELSFLQASYTSYELHPDSLRDTLYVGISLGPSYQWIKLGKGNVAQDILTGAGFRDEQFAGKKYSAQQFSKRVEKLIQFLENNGYPFASVQLDSVLADSAGISASLNLTLNERIVFDTIELIGNANIKKWYLYKYLGMNPQEPYNENVFKQAVQRLNQLPYLQVTRPAAVYFYGNKAMPILYLDNKQASSVDGVVGFAPNSTSSTDNKLIVTGEANLLLQNLFGTGKMVEVNYRSFLGNSQDLKFKFLYPYLLRSNLAFDYSLGLLKQDTTFLDVVNEFGLQYRFVGNDYFKVFYSVQNTSLITVDTTAIKSSGALPDAADLVNNTYGLGAKMSRYDYFINPQKGFGFEWSGGVGVKKILRNPTIDALQINDENGGTRSIYDTMELKYIQYRFKGMADYFIPVFSRGTIRTQLMGGHLVAQNVFINELFRIGGIRTLKGFDEQAIFASTYLIGNIEFRYLFQQNSNVLLFWNGAYYRNEAKMPHVSDKPYGFGAGVNIETGSGVLSLFYALGKELNNPINISRAKVHFGYVNYF